MSKPTPYAQLYAWHESALPLDGTRGPSITNEPQCGWYMRATGARNDPETKHYPAMIWMEQPVDENGDLAGDEALRCRVNGKDRDPREEWTWLAKRPITRQTYMMLMAQQFGGVEPKDAGEAKPSAPKKRTPY